MKRTQDERLKIDHDDYLLSLSGCKSNETAVKWLRNQQRDMLVWNGRPIGRITIPFKTQEGIKGVYEYLDECVARKIPICAFAVKQETLFWHMTKVWTNYEGNQVSFKNYPVQEFKDREFWADAVARSAIIFKFRNSLENVESSEVLLKKCKDFVDIINNPENTIDDGEKCAKILKMSTKRRKFQGSSDYSEVPYYKNGEELFQDIMRYVSNQEQKEYNVAVRILV